MENNEKPFWERVISSDINLTFLLVNVVGIMWYVTIKQHPLPEGMVMLVLGIFGGKTAHGIMQAKNGNSNGNGNGHSILSQFKGPKKL